MDRKKSAKDIAFDKERAKYRSEMRNLQYQIDCKDKQIKELVETVYQREDELLKQEDWINRLLEYMDLSKQDMKRIIEKEKQRTEIAEHFKLCFSQKFLKSQY